MLDLLFRMLIGHLIGDYIFQNNWMALNKKTNWIAGVAHCLVWTLCVVAWVPEIAKSTYSIWIIFAIFISHIVLDATNFVDNLLDFLGGRSYKSAEKYCAREDIPDFKKAYMRCYTAIIQTVADNTLHLIFLYNIFTFFEIIK